MASSRDVESGRAVVLKESPKQQQAIGSREVAGYRWSCQQPALCPRRSRKCGPSSGEARWDENGDGLYGGRPRGQRPDVGTWEVSMSRRLQVVTERLSAVQQRRPPSSPG